MGTRPRPRGTYVLAPFSDHEYMTGALMQVNWAPVWKEEKKFDWLTDDVIQQLAEIQEKVDKPLDGEFLIHMSKVKENQVKDFYNDYPFLKDGLLMLNLMTFRDKKDKFGSTLQYYERKFIYANIVSMHFIPKTSPISFAHKSGYVKGSILN
jgi:hypothetical protein